MSHVGGFGATPSAGAVGPDPNQPPGYQQPPGYGQPPPQFQPQPGYPGQPPAAHYPYGAQPPVPPGMMQVQWMAKPSGNPNCPPGLEYLTQIDQVLIKQQVEMFEVFTGYEMNNRYRILNTMGQQIYFAKEETDFCVRNCCGPQRPFTMHVEDNMGHEVMTIVRPYKCNCVGQCFSCSECCQDELEVQAPPGQVVGYVKQLYEGCEIRYSIRDANKTSVLKIHGPNYCHCYCPGDDIPFSLLGSDGKTEVGRVSKQWSNLFREWYTDADNFGIQFPIDLDVKVKAVVLGAVFLIDFMYFEQTRKNRH